MDNQICAMRPAKVRYLNLITSMIKIVTVNASALRDHVPPVSDVALRAAIRRVPLDALIVPSACVCAKAALPDTCLESWRVDADGLMVLRRPNPAPGAAHHRWLTGSGAEAPARRVRASFRASRACYSFSERHGAFLAP